MNLSPLDILALIAIGIGVGLALALVAVMVYSLYRTVITFRASSSSLLNRVHEALAADKFAMDQLRSEVNLALSRIDAERLHAASLQIQGSAKLFSQQIDQLQRVVFAQPPAPAIDFTAPGMGMETEAEGDARVFRGTSAIAGAGPVQAADPLAYLTEEEKQRRVNEFFERRRQQSQQRVQPFSSTPPVAGSGVYSSLLDEAVHRQESVPPPLPTDFSGLESEEGVELVDKGELG